MKRGPLPAGRLGGLAALLGGLAVFVFGAALCFGPAFSPATPVEILDMTPARNPSLCRGEGGGDDDEGGSLPF
ncbi:MAG TPA: hypothetical protein VIW94_01925 [Acidimicrobiia bacterium]